MRRVIPSSPTPLLSSGSIQGRALNAIQTNASLKGRGGPADRVFGLEAVLTGGMDAGAILEAIGEVVFTWELDTDRLFWGGDAVAMLRLGSGRRIETGHALQLMIDELGGPSRHETILRARLRSDPLDQEPVRFAIAYAIEADDGSIRHVEEQGCCVSQHGLPALVYGSLRITDGRQDAEPDTAVGRTGLLTRPALLRALDAMLRSAGRSEVRSAMRALRRSAKRRASTSLAFLLVTLADLPHLNRKHGYEAIDELIGVVAARLKTVLRDGDRIGRYSGNKLGIALKSCSATELDAVKRRFEQVLGPGAIETSAGPIRPRLRIGAVLAPEDAQSVSEVVEEAVNALAVAKRRMDGDFVCVRRPRSFDPLLPDHRVPDEILDALNDRRITLALQPIACTRSRRIVYREALVRLTRRDGSTMGASELVPSAEGAGLLRHLDMRVVELAIQTLADDPDLTLSINVDGQSILDDDWYDLLAASLIACRVDPDRLIVEITETALIRDLVATSTVVKRLHRLGIRVALDDFGSGHTSFRTLRSIPIDIIKIDGAFIHDIKVNRDDRFFVRTLVDLARHLEMKTVAEWVTDEETAMILADLGVDLLQGELIGETRQARPADRPDCASSAL